MIPVPIVPSNDQIGLKKGVKLVSTVIVVSDTHHQQELKHAIHQPSFEEFRRVGVTASDEPEHRKQELRRKLKQVKFLTGNCSRDVTASCNMSRHHWDPMYFLLIHSLNGVRIAKELSADLGHDQIADAIVIIPGRGLKALPERRSDGILSATGSFEESLIKRSIVESMIRFINQEPPVYLRLDVSSVYPKATEQPPLSMQV